MDFRNPQVRRFFAENALYWLREYRFDGLRLDAVHAISEPDWLVEMVRFVRRGVGADRQVHLVLENDDNAARLLEQGFDAQWNDDAHHVLHHILTGETQEYYAAYSENVTGKLARFLAEGFVYQGEAMAGQGGRRRGEPSGSLPPTSFVFFLQNHDQTGNRPLGERLISLCPSDGLRLRAATALQMLCPHIPLLFMGEESGAAAPFRYFTSFADPAVVRAVREGRQAEFASIRRLSEGEEGEQAAVPEPNSIQTWTDSLLDDDSADEGARGWRKWYRCLLDLRKTFVTPQLAGARSESARILGPRSVLARWRLGNKALLSIYCNFSDSDISLTPELRNPNDFLVFDSGFFADGEAMEAADLAAMRAANPVASGRLPANSVRVTLTPGTPDLDCLYTPEQGQGGGRPGRPWRAPGGRA